MHGIVGLNLLLLKAYKMILQGFLILGVIIKSNNYCRAPWHEATNPALLSAPGGKHVFKMVSYQLHGCRLLASRICLGSSLDPAS